MYGRNRRFAFPTTFLSLYYRQLYFSFLDSGALFPGNESVFLFFLSVFFPPKIFFHGGRASMNFSRRIREASKSYGHERTKPKYRLFAFFFVLLVFLFFSLSLSLLVACGPDARPISFSDSRRRRSCMYNIFIYIYMYV